MFHSEDDCNVDTESQFSPGALGLNLEKIVESWNFQESYLDDH